MMERKDSPHHGGALITHIPPVPPLDAAEGSKKTKSASADGNLGGKEEDAICPTLRLPPLDSAESKSTTTGAAHAATAALPPLPSLDDATVGKKMVVCGKGAALAAAAEGGGKKAEERSRLGLIAKKTRQAIIAQAVNALPPPQEPTIEAEGSDKYNPYFPDFFLYRRALPPWDGAWKARPLVLHDHRLAEVLLVSSEEPQKDVDTMLTILGNHPGPVSSFRLESSLCPDEDTLDYLVDRLSEKGVEELVIFNVDRDTATVRFPLRRLSSTETLKTLAIGFFDIAANLSDGGWCSSALCTLSITGCTFLPGALSRTIQSLPCLMSLTVGACNLRDPTAAVGLIIQSNSLLCLRFWRCIGKCVTVDYAPALGLLEIGIDSHAAPMPGAGWRRSDTTVSIVLREADALRELHAVALPMHAVEIRGANCQVPLKRKSSYQSLHHLTRLGIAVRMNLPGQSTALVELLRRMPALSELTVSRADDIPSGGDDESETLAGSWRLQPPVPRCLKDTLTKVLIKDYRGGEAERSFITSLLRVGRCLSSVTLHLHPKLWASLSYSSQLATKPFDDSPRASKNCAICVAEESPAPSLVDSLMSSLP